MKSLIEIDESNVEEQLTSIQIYIYNIIYIYGEKEQEKDKREDVGDNIFAFLT